MIIDKYNHKSIRMKIKTLLTSFGLLNILQGLFMFFNGRQLTEGVFPGVGNEALSIGEQMHMPLGSAFVGLGFIFFICREIELPLIFLLKRNLLNKHIKLFLTLKA